MNNFIEELEKKTDTINQRNTVLKTFYPATLMS
jgi:hypothetical protein